MIPTQQRVGYYWQTNDDAALAFNEAGAEQPTHIKCHNMQDYTNARGSRLVAVADLTLIRKAHFQSGVYSWTGSSHKYGIYSYDRHFGRDGIVILEAHGGGMVAYYIESLTSLDTWDALCKLPEQILWNICHEMADAYRTARSAEAGEWQRAIAEKRTKTRRRGGMVYVSITQPEPKPAPTSVAA